MNEIILYSYTRKQAIEDGILFDGSQVAKEAGFKPPVAVSQAVWENLNNYPKGQGQSLDGRHWDLLWMLYVAIHQGGGGDTVMDTHV